LLCEVCELAVDAGQLQAIQWRRAVFSESVAERFCREIGAETAAWDFRDFDEVALEPGEPISAGGFRIERLDFERHGERSAPRAVRLHDVVLRTQAVEPVDPEMLQWQAQLQRQMLPLTIAVRIIALPFRLVVWLIGPLFALWWRWKGRQHVRSGDLLSELLDRDSKLRVERQGSQLVNHVHGCRITVPDTAGFLPSATREWVFSFQLEDAAVQCQAVRPSQLNEQLRAWPGAEIVQDEKITVDGRQARIVQLRGQAGNHSWCVAWYLIETGQAIYRFQVGGAELSAEVLASMRAILDSFRIDAATAP
jgi:hypothetical protein